MNRKLSVLLFVIVFGIPAYMRGQNANGIIAPSRMIDWSNAGVQGGIPNRTTVCSTLSPGVTATQISSAIASCPSGEVVYLKAGTYNLSSGIDFGGHSNVTLRGAGSDATFLVFTGSGVGSHPISNIRIGGDFVSQTSPPNLTSWTSGYSKGDTTITVGSVSNLSSGDVIFLDQQDNTSDNNGLYVCGSCGTEGSGSGTSRAGYTQLQAVQVTQINGTTLTISPGLYMDNWSSSRNPQAFWPNGQVTMDGVEDLSIDGTNSTAEASIGLSSAMNCWVKNVRSVGGGTRDHVYVMSSLHVSIVDSYFYGNHTYASSSYTIEFDNSSTSLVENNIIQHSAEPMTITNDEGNVYAYNYADTYNYPATSWVSPSLFPHGPGTLMDLLEGNVGTGLQSDDIWGSHDLVTAFRNWFTGQDLADLSRTSNSIPVQLQPYSRYYNLIGNVLGNPGYHTQYQDVVPNSNGDPNHTIYVLGWTGQVGGSGSLDDSLVASTLMRWGNYDVATGTARWQSSEVPSGLSQYANPVPTSQTLPASFFLSSKPGWWSTPWGTPPWPAIGPDVTGGPGPGGHSYDIPAMLCYDNTSKDSNGILNFNADSCYSSSAAPTAPTNLGAVAH